MDSRALDRRLEEENRKKNRRPAPPPEEVEEELPFPPMQALDRRKSVFDSAGAGTWGGINAAPSVFDRDALFKSGD